MRVNKHDRLRAVILEQHKMVSDLPEKLTTVPRDEWPPIFPRPIEVWRSCKYFVQLYKAPGKIDGLKRLTISRAKLGIDGRWEEDLTWDELQAIKGEVGFGDCYAVEIYPRDRDVVNDANMRHLWLLPKPLAIGWFGR